MLEGILKVEGLFLQVFLQTFLILYNGVLGFRWDY